MALITQGETVEPQVFAHYLSVQIVFLEALEWRLKRVLPPHLAEFRLQKTALAKADRHALQIRNCTLPSLPEQATRFINSHETAMGALYVIEGSTLGMQLLLRDLKDKQWAKNSLQLVRGYESKRQSMWREFVDELNNIPENNWQKALLSSQNTFHLLLKVMKTLEDQVQRPT